MTGQPVILDYTLRKYKPIKLQTSTKEMPSIKAERKGQIICERIGFCYMRCCPRVRAPAAASSRVLSGGPLSNISESQGLA